MTFKRLCYFATYSNDYTSAKERVITRMNASIISSTFSADGSRYYVYIRTRINVCLVRRALFRRDMMDASGDAKVEMAVTASGTKCRISIRQEMDGSIHGTLITIKSRAYTNANALYDRS